MWCETGAGQLMNEKDRQEIHSGAGYFPEKLPVDGGGMQSAEGRGHFSKAGVKPRAKVRRGRLALLILCCIVLLGSVAALGNYFWQMIRADSVSKELRAEYQKQLAAEVPAAQATAEPLLMQADSAAQQQQPLTTQQAAPLKATTAPASDALISHTRVAAYPDNPNLLVFPRFEALQKRNPDIIGWLSIPDVLDEAVVQRDNSYYLKRDYLGYHNVTGALFLDEGCKLQKVPEHLLIHGHNMKTGAMFGALKKYKVKGADFIKEHGILRFDTIYEEAQYAVFAVMEIDIRPTEYDFFNFMAYPTFSSDWEFEEFVKKAKKLSMYQINLDVRPSDRLLTLATCAGTDENKRLLVIGRMLRADENEIALKNALYSTKKK